MNSEKSGRKQLCFVCFSFYYHTFTVSLRQTILHDKVIKSCESSMIRKETYMENKENHTKPIWFSALLFNTVISWKGVHLLIKYLFIFHVCHCMCNKQLWATLKKIHLGHGWYRQLTIFIKYIKNIEISSLHYNHVFGRFILKERIFVNLRYSCSIEQTSILGHIQWKSLQCNIATNLKYIMHFCKILQKSSVFLDVTSNQMLDNWTTRVTI